MKIVPSKSRNVVSIRKTLIYRAENGSTNRIRVLEKQIIIRLVPMLEESTGIVALGAFRLYLDLTSMAGGVIANGDMVVNECYGQLRKKWKC